MHVHASAIDFAIFTAWLLLAMFTLRWLAARYADTTFGKALGSIVF